MSENKPKTPDRALAPDTRTRAEKQADDKRYAELTKELGGGTRSHSGIKKEDDQ